MKILHEMSEKHMMKFSLEATFREIFVEFLFHFNFEDLFEICTHNDEVSIYISFYFMSR